MAAEFNAATIAAKAMDTNIRFSEIWYALAKTTKTPAPSIDASPMTIAPPRPSWGLGMAREELAHRIVIEDRANGASD